MNSLENIIQSAWDDTSLRQNPEVVQAIEEVVEKVDKGILRTAEPLADES